MTLRDLIPAPKRVLIVRMSHLGDVAQTLPLVHGIQMLWPSAEIGWAIQPEFAPLVEPFARIFPFERRGGARAWPRIRAAMRAWRPDVTIDAQGNWKSAVCARLSGAPLRYGFERSAWQEPLAARVAGLEHAPPALTSPRHLVARCHSIAAHLGVEAPHELRLDPLLSTAEVERGRHLLLDALGEAPGSSRPGASAPPVTVLHPGVPADPRTWPEHSFLELGQRLVGRGRRVLFLTGPGEAASGEALRAAVPEAAHVVGQRGLRDLCAILHAAAERRGELFTSDSGPAHIAASVGLPVRLLAGPEDPRRTGPWPPIGSAAVGGASQAEESPHRLVQPPADSTTWSRRSIESVSVDEAERASDATVL